MPSVVAKSGKPRLRDDMTPLAMSAGQFILVQMALVGMPVKVVSVLLPVMCGLPGVTVPLMPELRQDPSVPNPPGIGVRSHCREGPAVWRRMLIWFEPG